MKNVPKGRYTKEFREEAVKLVTEEELSLPEALKQELVHHRSYATRNEAMREIREYIEVFYNRQKKQARLGYLSPAAYERRFYADQQMAA